MEQDSGNVEGEDSTEVAANGTTETDSAVRALQARVAQYEVRAQRYKMALVGVGMLILGGALGYAFNSNHGSGNGQNEVAAVGPAQGPAVPSNQPPVVPAKEVLEKLNHDAFVTYIGNKNAKVTMHEFVDFQCPACQGADLQFLIPFKKQYVETGKVRFGLVHWPLDQIHHYANMAAKSFVCAVNSGASTALSDSIFVHQQEWVVGGTSAADSAHVRQKLDGYAKGAGADMGRYRSCQKNDSQYDAKFQQNGQLAFSVGAGGTPTFFINGERLTQGGPAEIEQKIDALLKQ